MRSFKTLPQPVLEVILWVPENVLEGWFSADPEGAASVATEATRRLGETSTGDHEWHEDELLVERLVLSGGSELDLLRLAASGIIASKEVFHRAATWVKWRRTARSIIQMPEAQAVRQRLVGHLGPLGWDDPDVGEQRRVIEAIRAFESALMTWQMVTKTPTEAAMRSYIQEAASRMEFGVGRSTSTT